MPNISFEKDAHYAALHSHLSSWAYISYTRRSKRVCEKMKRCPYCYEEIQDQAIKCKHCFEWIEKPTGTPTIDQDSCDPLREWILKEINTPSSENLFESMMNIFEKRIIIEALHHTDNNRSKAAELLGLSRPTLHSKIEKHAI